VPVKFQKPYSVVLPLLYGLFVCNTVPAAAQSEARPQITAVINHSFRSAIPNSKHPFAQSAFDAGQVDPNLKMERMVLVGGNLSFGQHPYDWHRTGSNNRDYETGKDSQQAYGDKTRWPFALYIRSIHPSPAGFGTLIQTIGADDYRGERLRMTGFVKTENVRGDGVGMWMRVDGKGGSSGVLSFYNMCDRPIQGTTDWQKYEIILNVPKKSENIFYGLLLHGTGQAWLQDVKFEIVDHREHLSQMPRGGCPAFYPR